MKVLKVNSMIRSNKEYIKLLMWIDDLLDSPSLACIDAEENKIEEIVSNIIKDTNTKCKVLDFGIGTDNKPNYILGALNNFKLENPGIIPIIINLDKKLDLFNRGLQDLAYTINMHREVLIFYTCTPVIMICTHETMDALIQYAYDFVTTIDFRWSVNEL